MNAGKCTECGLCEKICVRKAINVKTHFIDTEKCFGCSQCVSVCPCSAISIDNTVGVKLAFKGVPSDELKKMFMLKRSVRFFKEKDIDERILRDIADIIKFAPTAKNQQEVYVTVVRDKEVLKKTSDLAIAYCKKVSSKANGITVPFLTLLLGKKIVKNLLGLKKMVSNYEAGKNGLTYNAKAIFIFHADQKAIMVNADCNIAATYASLYAESLGISSCINGYLVRAINGSKKLQKHLNIPAGHKVYETFIAGYPLYTYPNSPVRESKNITIL